MTERAKLCKHHNQMCRIAGLISQQINTAQQLNALQAMANTMRKGGPDGQGAWHCPESNLAFAHNRLALLDLSPNGKQPMHYGQNLTITFNGEIYNFKQLKQQLLNLGFAFSNQTDTEVILAGYQAHGTAFFGQLQGMFAFALHDKAAQKTFLVRDHQGIKPLYYYQHQNQLAFASEVKAFKALPNPPAPNPNWKIDFLAFGFIPEPYTTLANVYSLAKASMLTWCHNTHTASITKIATATLNQSANLSPAAQTASLLNSAVQSHLIADAPIGVFLSGGIDSSLLALIASQQTNTTVNTVSINFNEGQFSEKEYQDIIVQAINSKHTCHTVTQSDFETHIDQILADMDQPSNDGINTWFVNKVAKEKGLKAVLSGIGADEVFGGYPSFNRANTIKYLKMLPNNILRAAQYAPSDKIKRIAYLAYKNPIGEYLFLRGFYTPNAIAKLLNRSLSEVNQQLANYQLSPELDTLTGKNRMAWFETNVYMQNQLLKDTDAMSMAHGVEVRVPFLDQQLLQQTNLLSQQQRFAKQPKALLINAYQNLLPKAIWNRPKKGFTFPFQLWFATDKKITNPQHYQNNAQALQMLQAFKQNKLHWAKLFALYQVYQHEQ